MFFSAHRLFLSFFLFMSSVQLLASPQKIKDPVAHAFELASQSNAVADCERSDEGNSTSINCVSEVFETDMPCFDPSSPSGLEMCFGVEVIEFCDFEYKKVGFSYKLVSGPNCDTVRADEI